MTGPKHSYDDFIGFSFAYFSNRDCTEETLEAFLDLSGGMLDSLGVSRDKAIEDLQRRHTITIHDSASILEDHGDHVEWFNPSINNGIKRNIDWHFWEHYKGYLTSRKKWPKGIIDGIDRDSSMIVSKLEDPERTGDWDRRGMVMGSVQSGKTANYTALICKAIDAGYRLVVVLAGVHNSLRSQTQYRLSEEVLGYDMDTVQEFKGQVQSIGVRAMYRDHKLIQTLTTSNDKGDFKRSVAEHAGMIPSHSGMPIILVIKKHVSILKNVLGWSTAIIGEPDDAGGRVVKDVPLLIIDDECDYASVNTRKVELDENGLVDEECNPAETNRLIRKLLNAFRKSAYIGYTATPFANIFIHHEIKHSKYGEDLFPRNFIVTLPQPTNYVGVERVFGLSESAASELADVKPPSLVREVSDSDDYIPPKHDKHWDVIGLPDSLKEAVKAFILSCAVRRMRKCSPPHNSMLIHVTRYTDVQSQVKTLVESLLKGYVDKIRSGTDPLTDFKELWEKDFEPVTEYLSEEIGVRQHSWKEVEPHLYPVAGRIEVKLVNGTSTDALSYREKDADVRARERRGEELAWEEKGEHVIAIGGDKLSRGLTLDGLSISYYLRASKLYDTLMQMGRWFGYRDGYLDVCRIYTTEELSSWYRFIASASAELRLELEYMALVNKEPKEFGLKVLNHPGQLAITSAGKRRNAEDLNLSYSGRISETVVFDLRYSRNNLKALARLVEMAESEGEPGLAAATGRLHWRGVSPETIISYLNSYRTHEEAARIVDPKKIALFIEEQQANGDNDLVEWDVYVASREGDSPHSFELQALGGKNINCFMRIPANLDGNLLSIGRLVNPPDEWVDFNELEKEAARKTWVEWLLKKNKPLPEKKKKLPTGPAIRANRPKERGLLLIYPICWPEEDSPYGMKDGQEVTGFAVSFPDSNTSKQISYMVNSVFQDAED